MDGSAGAWQGTPVFVLGGANVGPRNGWPRTTVEQPTHPAQKSRATRTKTDEAQPRFDVEFRESQPLGTLRDLPIGLAANARTQSVTALNQVLADTITLRDRYKKHH